LEKKIDMLTPDEKLEELFKRWHSPQGVEFVNPETEKNYKERVTRIRDAIELKKVPDRVPVVLTVGFFPAYYSGITPKEAMYDYDKLFAAWKKAVLDFEPDAQTCTKCIAAAERARNSLSSLLIRHNRES